MSILYMDMTAIKVFTIITPCNNDTCIYTPEHGCVEMFQAAFKRHIYLNTLFMLQTIFDKTTKIQVHLQLSREQNSSTLCKFRPLITRNESVYHCDFSKTHFLYNTSSAIYCIGYAFLRSLSCNVSIEERLLPQYPCTLYFLSGQVIYMRDILCICFFFGAKNVENTLLRCISRHPGSPHNDKTQWKLYLLVCCNL